MFTIISFWWPSTIECWYIQRHGADQYVTWIYQKCSKLLKNVALLTLLHLTSYLRNILTWFVYNLVVLILKVMVFLVWCHKTCNTAEHETKTWTWDIVKHIKTKCNINSNELWELLLIISIMMLYESTISLHAVYMNVVKVCPYI